jgi:outer membrane protein OmpA-like peptidoglycan-associated protein
MPSSSFGTPLPASAIQSVASHLGTTSERTILNGVQSSIATVVSGLSQKSGDRGFLSQVLQTASATPENAVSSALSSGSLTNPASSFMTGSAQFLSSIFGNKLAAISEALGSQTGLRSTAVSILLALGAGGVEGKLLTFIQDPASTPNKTSWFDFDRLLFNTDSASLEPQSADQLNSIAGILKACPAVHLTIGGYTDNTGDPAHNLKLSQERANSVVAQLVTMGIASDRMVAKGYGDQHPVGDNSTDEGRALNRRISMLVTAK